MANKQRELSWSLSKARMFHECPRRLYFHYYFARFGATFDAPEEARLASEMKRIKGLDMWAGEIVHQVIQWSIEQIRNGSSVSVQEAQAEAKRLLSSGWKSSKLQEWRRFQDDEHPNLFQHYYGIEVGQATINRIKEKSYTSVENFVNSGLFGEIQDTPPDRWLPVEKYASFRIDGMLTYVKFDFAVRHGKQLMVYDWKTGKPSDDENRQLTCYAMYTTEKWGILIENAKACAVHLHPEMDMRDLLVGVEEMEELRTYARQSFDGIVRCLRNPARDIAVMDDFPTTGNYLRCVWCNFRGVCEQGKVASGDPGDLPGDSWEEA